MLERPIGEEAPPLRGCVLDTFDHAVAVIVHNHHDEIELLLHRGPKLSDVQKESAIAGHANRFPVARGRGCAQSQRQALPDSGANWEHALVR